MNDSMIPEKFSKFIGPAFLLLVIVTGAFYFTRPVTNNQALGNIARFNHEFHPGWIRMTDESLEDSLRGKLPAPWNIEVSRTIMTRWRLGAVSEKPFENLSEDYRRGLWLFPENEVYEKVLREIDQDWIERRQESEGEFNLLQNVEKESEDNHIFLHYEIPVSTASIGSKVVAIFECDQPITRQQAPNMYLSIAGIGRKPFMRRTGVVDYLNENTVLVSYDMSWDPIWLADKSKIAQLSFEFSSELDFELIELMGTDSPLLPVE